MTLHAPEVVRAMRLSEARACLRGLFDARRQEAERMAELGKLIARALGARI